MRARLSGRSILSRTAPAPGGDATQKDGGLVDERAVEGARPARVAPAAEFGEVGPRGVDVLGPPREGERLLERGFLGLAPRRVTERADARVDPREARVREALDAAVEERAAGVELAEHDEGLAAED